MKYIALQKTLYVLGAIIVFCFSSLLMNLYFYTLAQWDISSYQTLSGMVTAIAFVLAFYCTGKAYNYSRYIRILQGAGTAQEKEEAVSYFCHQGHLEARELLEGKAEKPD